MWKCPHCEEEIESLNFTAQTQGWESGSAILLENNTEHSYDRVVDYDYSDSGTDETNDYEYTCSECEHSIDLRELIWQEKTEKKEIIHKHIPCYTCIMNKNECDHRITGCKHCKQNPEKEIEEEKHKIIKPKNKIIIEDRPKAGIEDGIICKNKKCKYIFVYEINTDIENDEFYECPKCQTTNSKKEYLKQLEN